MQKGHSKSENSTITTGAFSGPLLGSRMVISGRSSGRLSRSVKRCVTNGSIVSTIDSGFFWLGNSLYSEKRNMKSAMSVRANKNDPNMKLDFLLNGRFINGAVSYVVFR